MLATTREDPREQRHRAIANDASRREIAASALIILLTGPQLLPFVNREAVLRQAQEVAADKAAKKAEQSMHHPLLMRRLAHVYAA